VPDLRYRSQDLRASHVGSQDVGVTLHKSAVIGVNEQCWDVDNGDFWTPNPFHLIRTKQNTFIFDGERPGRKVVGWPAAGMDAPSLRDEPHPYDLLAWRTQLFERANIARTEVNIPNLIGESRQLIGLIPDLLRLASRRGLPPARPKHVQLSTGAVGAANLTYHWGIAPMISDLRKVLHFANAVEQRMQQLEKMQERGYSRVSTQILVDAEELNSESLVISDLGLNSFITAKHNDSIARRVWATGRLYPGSFTRFDNMNEVRKQLNRAMNGLTVGGVSEALWELIPWSWLIDWFVDIGGYLSAVNNELDLQLRDVAIMVRDISLRESSLIPDEWQGWLTPRNPKVANYVERKLRFVIPDWAPYVPTLKLPIIDWRRLSILGSLAGVRFKK